MKDQKYTDYRFVLVVWRDSFGPSGWISQDQVDTDMPAMVSAGWLIEDSPHQITLASHLGPGTTIHSPLTVPMEAIVYLDDVPLPDIDDQCDAARNPESYQ